MPELRKDPIINRWVIVAKERSRRPISAPAIPEQRSTVYCPFCPGHEEKTPESVLTLSDPLANPDERNWELRVVQNKFPALVLEGTPQPQFSGMYEWMDGIGTHEVVIETPDHCASMGEYDDDHMKQVVEAYRARILVLSEDPRFRYILVFKNHGQQAGASLDHPHSQIIALPIVPKRVSEEMAGAKAYLEKNSRCIFCEIIQQEQRKKCRVVRENEGFIAIAPFAARFPYETWVLPKCHEPAFERIETGQMTALGILLRDVLCCMKNALNDPPFNFMIHTSPCREADRHLASYHWHIEITPKLTQVAGFEWATGFYINPVPPESAAELLRTYDAHRSSRQKNLAH